MTLPAGFTESPKLNPVESVNAGLCKRCSKQLWRPRPPVGIQLPFSFCAGGHVWLDGQDNDKVTEPDEKPGKIKRSTLYNTTGGMRSAAILWGEIEPPPRSE